MATVYNRAQIVAALTSIDVIAAVEAAFAAYSRGEAVVPPPGELLFDEPPGDCHIQWQRRGRASVIKRDKNRTFRLATRSALLPEASSIGGDFMTVSAHLRAAPSAMVRFGLVGEPQDARLIFTAPHEFEIGSCEQRGGSFRDWGQNRFGCILSSHGVDLQLLRFAPYELGVTLARS